MRSHTLRRQVSAQARGAAASIDACATLAVVVDDRLTDPDLGPSLPSVAGRLVAELADELDTSSAPVIGAWATRGIAAGSPWWTLLGRPDRGVLTDPALSSIALERLVEGQPVYRSRQELLDALAPDPILAAQVEPLPPAARSRAQHQRHHAGLHGRSDRLPPAWPGVGAVAHRRHRGRGHSHTRAVGSARRADG
ncbi:DUF4192 family protein [Nocardia amamiensis]|uniref:DUF4192 family protein n=1 Tax=Nocardia amamiensis TaxID=404578 RepID=UPI00341031A5